MANTDEECSICRDTYRDGNVKKTLPCSHAFHLNCIEEWLLRKGTCPNCRARISDDTVEESDSENDVEPTVVEEGTVIVNGRHIPRYMGNLRYDPSLQRYITPEEGVMMYLCGKCCSLIFFLLIGIFIIEVAGFFWADNMIYPMLLTTNSKQLEVRNNGKRIRNSGANFWDGGLHNLNGIASSVPLRFFSLMDIEIQIYYKILEKMNVGDTVLQIGFIPTQFIDKDELIQVEKGLVISVLVCEDNEICLAIINFGVTIRTIHLSDNRRGSEFVGRLTLRKLQQNISAYLKISQTSKLKHIDNSGEQATFQTTDMPDTPAPDGVYIHTFEKINNMQEDLWPVFVLSKKRDVIASLGSHLFYEPSCNKHIFIFKEKYSISNKKLTGFDKCKQKPRTSDPKEIDQHFHFAHTTSTLYSYNPFRFRVKSYNFSLSIEFAKSLRYERSTTGVIVFLILLRPRDPYAENFAVYGEMHDHHMEVIYENNNDTLRRDNMYFKNDFSIKMLYFSFEVNYHFNTLKLDMCNKNSRKCRPHLFENIVFYETPVVILGLSEKAIIEMKLD